MQEVAILVPIYKEELSRQEAISLKQIHNVLDDYPIIYIEPESLDFKSGHEITILRFEEKYFKSVKTYNDLLLNPSFYESFKEYRYILICQLDVFIFSDRLKFFCDLGYDYYGAPWLNGTPLNAGEGWRIKFVGNGGLSLRNVQKTIDLLYKKKEYAKRYDGNEDYFFSYYASKEYRIAPSDICRDFCIETQVKRSMEINHGKLPFGAHAWERYDYAFWKPYIESFGYELNDEEISYGNEDEDNSKGIIRVSIANIIRTISDEIYRGRK